MSADPDRHVLLVTATPHGGNEAAFRSLLHLLREDFAILPEDLDRTEREGARRQLARHLVQRRRADTRHYLDTDTAFPERRDKEAAYRFGPAYRRLFEGIFTFAREYVSDDDGERRRRRVRYWSALALLRCISSSSAAAATLRSRAAADKFEDEDVDEVGRRTVLDQGDDDDTAAFDFSPGSTMEKGAGKRRAGGCWSSPAGPKPSMTGPAVGSGHFLVGAAYRLAQRLARVHAHSAMLAVA